MPMKKLTLVLFCAVMLTAAAGQSQTAESLKGAFGRETQLLDEAVDYVSDRLPPDSQARLTPAEVEQLLVFHMQWLHSKGLQPDDVVDRPQDIDETVVINEDALTAYLLGEADRNGIDLLADVDAFNVAEAHLAYLDAIGAVGPQAPLDDVIE